MDSEAQFLLGIKEAFKSVDNARMLVKLGALTGYTNTACSESHKTRRYVFLIAEHYFQMYVFPAAARAVAVL